MTEINHPFAYKVSRYFFSSEVQSEDIGNLCRKDGNGNTTGKSYNNGIRNEFDNSSQLEYT
eukprot:6451632-Prorocentrum_lima.AAC.1